MFARIASLVIANLLLISLSVTAQERDDAPPTKGEQSTQDPDTPVDVGASDVVVVTASRVEQRLQEVPATMTVITAEQMELLPADDYGDVLRNVPGLNVSQVSARDVQITGRQANGTLANTELVLVDGRTLFLDFLGFVMWDFMPVSPREIKQIEVVRGPGSAVWGANAMTGVINVITKRPRDMVGTSLTLGGGELNTLYGNVSHAGASDRVGYKVSATYYEQDPYERPTGTIPGTDTPYPDFPNEGTEQPKLDLRVDWDSSPESIWSFSGGWAATDGIIHSGIGPFDIDKGSAMSYARAGWTHRAMSLTFFANRLDGEASNLLTIGDVGTPLLLGFDSTTMNLDYSNTKVLGESHILTYGANARTTNFDLTIAPSGDNRDEVGIYLQDEILFGDKVRWVIGGRLDDIDPIDTVFSPRTSLLVSPSPAHTFRFSVNRAFRAPALIENYLDITTVTILPLPSGPFPLPTDTVGNVDLDEEQLTAYEVAYVATLPRDLSLTLAIYRNDLADGIDFFPALYYSSSMPPPGWPLPPQLFDLPILKDTLPATFTYRNVAEAVNRGAELALNGRAGASWSWFVNYSFQDDPDVTGVPEGEYNLPPNNRFNVGASYNGPRFFASATVNHADGAFWTDVLDARFHGPTDAYTQVNASLGIRLRGNRASFQILGQNIFDEFVQQHIFGDIISRKVTAQLRFEF